MAHEEHLSTVQLCRAEQRGRVKTSAVMPSIGAQAASITGRRQRGEPLQSNNHREPERPRKKQLSSYSKEKGNYERIVGQLQL